MSVLAALPAGVTGERAQRVGRLRRALTPTLSKETRIRLVAALAVTVAVAANVRTGYGHAAWWAPVALAVAVAACELNVTHLNFGKQRWTFSLTEGAIAAALVLSPGAWITLGVAAGVLVSQLARHQQRLKVEFNLAQFAAGAALAGLTAQAFGRGAPGAAIGMGVFWLVNHVLVTGAITIMSERRYVDLVRQSAMMSAVHSAGTGSLGLLGAWLTGHAPVFLLALVIPQTLLWLSYDEQSNRTAEARLFAELARGHERAVRGTVDTCAQAILTATLTTFDVSEVQMVLRGIDGPLHYLADGSGVTRRRTETSVFDTPWVLAALGARGAHTGVDAQEPYCSLVLGNPASPIAVLRATRNPGSMPFGRRDLMLAERLATQAEAWLSVAVAAESRDVAVAGVEAAESTTRELSDLGAATAPTLSLLRDSATRLAHLASEEPNEINDIVEELHAAERAVASLLGALTLAAVELYDEAEEPATRAVAGGEWTTTGSLASVGHWAPGAGWATGANGMTAVQLPGDAG